MRRFFLALPFHSLCDLSGVLLIRASQCDLYDAAEHDGGQK